MERMMDCLPFDPRRSASLHSRLAAITQGSGRASSAPRVIAITSGKGGVGKSVVAANLSLCLAQRGRRVLLIDADLALANLDLLLGVSAKRTVRDVLEQRCEIAEALVQGPEGLTLLPACPGDARFAEFAGREHLLGAVDGLDQRFDTLIVDTGAGIGSNAVDFAAAAQQIVVVVTPDPTAMADAYAMIKVLAQRGIRQLHLLVNMAQHTREGDDTATRLVALTARFLDVEVLPVGCIVRDPAVERSVRGCEPVVLRDPAAPATRALRGISDRLLRAVPLSTSARPTLFWRRVVGLDDDGALEVG